MIDWRRRRLVTVVAQEDASQHRFLTVCLAWGDPKVNRQMQLSRKSSTKTSSNAEEDQANRLSDAILVSTAYNQSRAFVVSHHDPVENVDAPADAVSKRDVWNEAPSAQEQLLASAKTEGANASTASLAIIRTTMGDIHIQLFPSQTPKTVQNFVGHAKAGYYDGVIFHRVIHGFMLQTGDPAGDGTGGESIWGGEFEDEFVDELRHDRPGTVSMVRDI